MHRNSACLFAVAETGFGYARCVIWKFAIMAGLYLFFGLASAIEVAAGMFCYHVIFHSIGANNR